jgi:preprotein translocase subunit SecG
VFLVILILLQAGKEGMGVIFGGGNTSVFGSAGAGGILVKLTTLMAVIFVITSLSYTFVTSSRKQSESVILNVTIEDSVTPAVTDKAVQKFQEGAPASVPSLPPTPSGDDKKP